MRPEPGQVTDVKLLHSIALRDEQALAALYDRYRRILFGLLMRILDSRDEAEEVLQEVFLQVWRRAADFDEQRGRPFTWLVTLTRSRAIDRLRQIASRERLDSSVVAYVAEEVRDPIADASLSEQRKIVNAALAELSEEQRKTLILAYFEGLTQSEIAARLSSPLGTVKTRMRAGMIRLRELLQPRLDAGSLPRNPIQESNG